jgi:LysM repeat protein
LQIGQKLIIPGASASTTTTAPTAPASATTAPDAGQSTDDILNSVKDPAAATTAPAPAAAPADNKEVLAAPAAKDSGSSYVGTDTLTLPTDTTVEKIAEQYGIKVDDLKRLNPDLPKDGKLKAGTLLLLPDVK